MSSTPRNAILNTSLPSAFRQIRLELARESGHPEGDPKIAYVLVAPLDSNNKINPSLWKKHRDACRVARLRPDQADELGHLVHRPGGSWAIHYDSSLADEVGYHFSDESFVVDEYVSLNGGDNMHTFRVAAVSAL